LEEKTDDIDNVLMFKIHKMTQEQLRMQMLAGIITEGQSQEMLNGDEELSIYLDSAEDAPESIHGYALL
jgi:hypothetical protein